MQFYGPFSNPVRKQFAKEAEVEEVHIQENFETPTKRSNVQVFKFNEKWKDGHPP